jgi:putative toxin-antitoxin system antitoxin component (TIGR02293 family)
MFAEVMSEQVYHTYRLRLDAALHIPSNASDLQIHELIVARFSAASAMALYEQYTFSVSVLNKIIPMNRLCLRLGRGQRLTLGESDRLFRLAHVTALAEAVFGDKEKAQRWLNKPKQRFSSEKPIELLSTSQGTLLVEELLIEVYEGGTF